MNHKTEYINQENNSALPELEHVREKRVRKNWLVSFFILCFLALFSEFFKTFGDDGIGKDLMVIGLVIDLILPTLFLAPWFLITYYCAFKKRGTAWLTWIMITFPLGGLIHLLRGGCNDIGEWNAVNWLLVSAFLSIQIYFLVNCYRLYKVNSTKKELLL